MQGVLGIALLLSAAAGKGDGIAALELDLGVVAGFWHHTFLERQPDLVAPACFRPVQGVIGLSEELIFRSSVHRE